MRRNAARLCCMLLALGVTLGARANVFDAPGQDLEVSLITYGPGAIYWERFGHDAIRIRDRISGESVDFNYGVFDFEDRAFLLNFARGHMRYMIDIEYSDSDQQRYIDAGRSTVSQRLALTASQAVSLRALLLWNLRPENVSYSYDYFTRNCATRVRDALNWALGGALQPALTVRPAHMTYRQQVDRLMSAQPWLMLAMDLALGPAADHPLNAWQESFLPTVLARELRSVRIADGHGGVTPLVVSERQIAPDRLTPPRAMPPDLAVPLAIAGLALAATMLAARERLPRLYAALATAYLVAAGLVGTMLLAFWTLTLHRAIWGNANLLVFNPLAFALLPAAWRTRHGMGASRLVGTWSVLQLGAALLGVLLVFLSGAAQHNLPWLLFAIPIWLAVAVGLRGAPLRVAADLSKA